MMLSRFVFFNQTPLTKRQSGKINGSFQLNDYHLIMRRCIVLSYIIHMNNIHKLLYIAVCFAPFWAGFVSKKNTKE